MIGVERRCLGSEQLVVLWTWLLKGYVPAAHIVADLEELEAFASNESGDAPRGLGPRARAKLARMQFEGRDAA
jgi:hypothetical protein